MRKGVRNVREEERKKRGDMERKMERDRRSERERGRGDRGKGARE